MEVRGYSSLKNEFVKLLFSFFSFMGTSSDIYIVLKRSLKWVPIIGWVGPSFSLVRTI